MRFVFLLMLVLPPEHWSAQDEAREYARSVVTIVGEESHLALRDIDGDGRQDLVFVEVDGVAIRYLRPDGSYPDEHDTRLVWPSKKLAWCLADTDGNGSTEIVLLTETEVRAYAQGEAREMDAGEVLLAATAALPHGVVHMRFLRDIDDDGRGDLVLPRTASFAIHRRLPDGGFEAPIEVALESEVDHDVGDPEELDGRFGQEVRIPWFSLEDVDGNGLLDLVAETDEEVLFHLALPKLATEPTWRLDLEELRSELPEQEQIDLDDLLSGAARGVNWRTVDLDGTGANELVLQIGNKFRLYREGALTGPAGTPDQVLKSSGNVLYFFLRDVEGDERPDLQILRAGKLSVPQVLRWLILPGKLDFDLFTYRCEAGAFSRKPTRRNVVALRFPRLFAFVEEIEEREKEMENRELVPARRAALGKDSVPDDIVDLRAEELVVFFGLAPEVEDGLLRPDSDDPDAFIEAFILSELDAAGDGATKEIDLGELDDWGDTEDVALREATSERTPDCRVPLVRGVEDPRILVQDIDGDGRDDLLVCGQTADSTHVVLILVGRP